MIRRYVLLINVFALSRLFRAGPGVAPLAISVARNTGAARTGTITIGDASIAVMQAGGSESVGAPAAPRCQWVVTGLPPCLTVTSGASGAGNGTVTLAAIPKMFTFHTGE